MGLLVDQRHLGMLTNRPIEHQIINMFITLPILVLFIFATPLTIIFDGPIIQGLVAAVAALPVAIVALRIRPGEAVFLSTVIQPVAAVAAVPAIWMLISVIPSQSVGLAHPIWKSAAAALGKPLAGTISVDTGMTLSRWSDISFDDSNRIRGGGRRDRSAPCRMGCSRSWRRRL